MKGLVTETKDGLATVHILRKEACGECRACARGMMEKNMDIEAANLCDAEVGDWVELELRDNAFMHAVLIMYGIPLVAFLGGIILGYFALGPLLPIPESLTSILMGALGVFVSYLWIKSQNPRWESGKYRPMAINLTEAEGDSCGVNG